MKNYFESPFEELNIHCVSGILDAILKKMRIVRNISNITVQNTLTGDFTLTTMRNYMLILSKT